MRADRIHRIAYQTNWWSVLFKGMLIGALLTGGCTTIQRVIQPERTILQPVIIQRNYLVPVIPGVPRYQPPPDIGEA